MQNRVMSSLYLLFYSTISTSNESGAIILESVGFPR